MKRRPFLKFPPTVLAVFMVFYVLLTSLALIDVPTWHWAEVRSTCFQTRCMLLVFGCFAAGLARVLLLHPHYARKYASWLMSTPWHPGLQLPLGPVHLVWEDLLLLVPMGILARLDVGVTPWLPATCYLFGFSWASVCSLRAERGNWFALGLVFLWSLPLLRLGSNWLLAGSLVIVALYANLALSISLRHFPWDLGDSMRETNLRPRSALAWPLDRVGPVVMPKPIPLAFGWMAAAVAAWWVFVVLNLLTGLFGGILLEAVAIEIPPVCAIFCLMRLLYYCLGYWPPIGLLGRVMTGRLIIPGYDYVFIAPAICCLVAILMPRVFEHHLPLQISSALTVLCVAGAAINVGPTIRSWRLTGHHRFIPMARREPVVPKDRNTR